MDNALSMGQAESKDLHLSSARVTVGPSRGHISSKLSVRSFRRRGNPQCWKSSLYQQPKNVPGIAPIRLLPAHITGSDGRRIPHLETMPHLLQHLLEPLRIPAGLDPYQHLLTAQRGIKLLRFLLVHQLQMPYLAAVRLHHQAIC